jgi:hypothetical protein
MVEEGWVKKREYCTYARYWLLEYAIEDERYRDGDGDVAWRKIWAFRTKIGPFESNSAAKEAGDKREASRKDILLKLNQNKQRILEEITELNLFFSESLDFKLPLTKYEIQEEEKTDPI